MVKRWTVGLSHFPSCAEGPLCETEGLPERQFIMFKNTELGCDVKTILHSDRRMRTGKDYQGVLRRDSESDVDEFRCRDAHYTFIEMLPWTAKRNPRVYKGKYITITRRPDGTLKPNFRPVKMDADFSPERYALAVANELMWALEGLIEENVTI